MRCKNERNIKKLWLKAEIASKYDVKQCLD